MATFQSQINILAAANCGVKERLRELESKKLEVHYGATETTIKDNDDDPLITINNLGYNAYDAMLIMKNDSPDSTERSYYLMGYDGENLKLGMNTEVGAKIGKAMEEQTMKLMELTNMTNERELLRWDFSYKFKSESETVFLDETDFSLKYPIKIVNNGSYNDLALENLLDAVSTSYYIFDTNNSFSTFTGDFSDSKDNIIYYEPQNTKIPIGFHQLDYNNADNNSYCVVLDPSTIDGFIEELTITTNPTFNITNEIEFTLINGEDPHIILYDTDSLTFLSYNNIDNIMTVQTKDGTKISFEFINKNILRLATSSFNNKFVQYCYVNIKTDNIKNLKVNNINVNPPQNFNISFPWGSIGDKKIFELYTDTPGIPNDKILTKIDKGHLYTTVPNTYLDENNARYRNINIINAMKPLQNDIKDEKEGEKEGEK